MSEKFLQHMRALILKGYVAGLIPRELARKKCNMITREIERMSSMKAEYRAEIKQEQERSKWYQEGYLDGAMEGYERALKDIMRMQNIAAQELLRGFGHGLDKAEH